MNIDMSSEEKVSLLVSVSKHMGLSVDDILAVYLLLGDAVFFLFDLLQGRTVKFPSMRSFHRGLSQVKDTRLVKLKHSRCLVNGVESYREDIVSGDVVNVEGANVKALSNPFSFFGCFYLLVTDHIGGK